MRIYLAEGFTVMCQKGRERELMNKFNTWKRLVSFYFKKEIYTSEIMTLRGEQNENK